MKVTEKMIERAIKEGNKAQLRSYVNDLGMKTWKKYQSFSNVYSASRNEQFSSLEDRLTLALEGVRELFTLAEWWERSEEELELYLTYPTFGDYLA